MKKLMPVLLLLLFVLPFMGCQAKEQLPGPVGPKQTENQPVTVSLAELPETKDMLFTVEGTEESATVTKALHDEFYAMYYDTNGFAFVPGEILDTGFSDSFISLYDDESTMVLTTMKVCYTADRTPEQWIESTANTEWAPQTDITSSVLANWEPTEQNAALGKENQSFRIWTASDSVGVTNYCYTTPFRGGSLAVIVSYPNEVAEEWGTRMEDMVQTLILAEEE